MNQTQNPSSDASLLRPSFSRPAFSHPSGFSDFNAGRFAATAILSALFALVGFGATTAASAQAGECFPTCRAGFVCNPSNQCVSICNPGCGVGQVCTAEATCINNPAGTPVQAAPQATPRTQAPRQQNWQPRARQPRAPVQQTYTSSRNPAPVSPPYPQAAPTPTPTSAVSDIARSGRFRLIFSADLGFAGGVEISNDNGGAIAEGDTGISIGGGLVGLFPLGRVFLLGAELATHTKDVIGTQNTFVRIGPSVGFHYALQAGSVAVDPFVLFTAGLAIQSTEGVEGSDEGFGFATRVGLNIWASNVAGVRFALGYQQANFWRNNLNVVFGEMFMEVGVSLRFGG